MTYVVVCLFDCMFVCLLVRLSISLVVCLLDDAGPAKLACRSSCVSCRASEARMYDAGPMKLARQRMYPLKGL